MIAYQGVSKLRLGLRMGAAAFAMLSTGAWASAGAPAAVDAEASAPQGAGEIIVTATRREGQVKDTPLAIAATTGAELVKSNVSTFQDLTFIQPALTVNNQGAASNQFIIRGILSDSGATTGFYLDEAVITGAGNIAVSGDGKPGMRMLDVQRIEVLKGPQGTLFGTGALAGTLRIVTNKPSTDGVEGRVGGSVAKVEGGNWLKKIDGMINVPMSDRIAIRAVGWGEFGGGYVDGHTGLAQGTLRQNMNDRNIGGGRVQLLLKATDDLKIIASASYQSLRVDGADNSTIGRGTFTGPYDNNQETVQPYNEKVQLYSLTAEQDVGFGKILAIGTYGKNKLERFTDTTPAGKAGLAGANKAYCPATGPVAGATCPIVAHALDFSTLQDFKDWTAELRFASEFSGPLQLVTGLYYERDEAFARRSTLRADDVTGEIPCIGLDDCTTLGLRNKVYYAQNYQIVVKQWAAYGQVDYDITSKLRATAGIRYYEARQSRKTDDIETVNGGLAQVITTPVYGPVNKVKESSPSYNFSLLYKATDDLTIYARAASGFRIGGVNDAAAIAAQSGVTIPAGYGSDTLWSYELGAKGNLFDRKLYAEFTVYQMDWTNMQVSARDATTALRYFINAGKVRIRGAELNLNYKDGPFSANLGGTYTDAKLTQDLPAVVLAAGVFGYKGDRVPRVPHWSIAGQAEYEVPVGNAKGYIRGNFTYRSSSFYNWNAQNTFQATIPSYVMFGAAMGARFGKADVALFVENLGNKAAIYGYGFTTGNQLAFVAQPRTIGLKVNFGF